MKIWSEVEWTAGNALIWRKSVNDFLWQKQVEYCVWLTYVVCTMCVWKSKMTSSALWQKYMGIWNWIRFLHICHLPMKMSVQMCSNFQRLPNRRKQYRNTFEELWMFAKWTITKCVWKHGFQIPLNVALTQWFSTVWPIFALFCYCNALLHVSSTFAIPRSLSRQKRKKIPLKAVT